MTDTHQSNAPFALLPILLTVSTVAFGGLALWNASAGDTARRERDEIAAALRAAEVKLERCDEIEEERDGWRYVGTGLVDACGGWASVFEPHRIGDCCDCFPLNYRPDLMEDPKP